MRQKEVKLENTVEVESKHTLLLINVEANIDTSEPQFCFNPADYLINGCEPRLRDDLTGTAAWMLT